MFPALLLVECAASSIPRRVVEPRLSEAPAQRGPLLLRAAMLDGHNAARAAVGMQPLAWDDTLASEAANYAETLARTGRFEHSPEPRGAVPEGENLFAGTHDAYSYAEMIGLWVAEQAHFQRRPIPDVSDTGRFGDVGHYTQIVWAGTTRVGCGLAHDAHDDFLVCRYTPPGNVVGQDVFERH